MNHEQTLSTLRFAERAKKIHVKARVNEVIDDHDLVQRLKQRIAELENQGIQSLMEYQSAPTSPVRRP